MSDLNQTKRDACHCKNYTMLKLVWNTYYPDTHLIYSMQSLQWPFCTATCLASYVLTWNNTSIYFILSTCVCVCVCTCVFVCVCVWTITSAWVCIISDVLVACFLAIAVLDYYTNTLQSAVSFRELYKDQSSRIITVVAKLLWEGVHAWCVDITCYWHSCPTFTSDYIYIMIVLLESTTYHYICYLKMTLDVDIWN